MRGDRVLGEGFNVGQLGRAERGAMFTKQQDQIGRERGVGLVGGLQRFVKSMEVLATAGRHQCAPRSVADHGGA